MIEGILSSPVDKLAEGKGWDTVKTKGASKGRCRQNFCLWLVCLRVVRRWREVVWDLSFNCYRVVLIAEDFKDMTEISRFHKRAFKHNYRAPFIYHIIFKKSQNCEIFGEIKGDARIFPGLPGSVFVDETELGHLIAKKVFELHKKFSFLQVYQFRVMPDHVHILLNVKEWLEQELDYYMDLFVKDIAYSYSQRVEREVRAEEIFQPGFCDKPLLRKRSLQALFQYIRENPHRLAIRQQFPQFFHRARKLKIGEEEYEAYGNLFLFRNPDKEAVKIKRIYTQEQVSRLKKHWVFYASMGTVLVSPFISKDEKAVRYEAEKYEGRIILITHEEFGERYKPAAHDFKLCCEGRLMIVSLGMPAKTPLSRDICEKMNALAAKISTPPGDEQAGGKGC